MKVAKQLAILAVAIAVLAGAYLLSPLAGPPAPLLSSATAYAMPGTPGAVMVAIQIENRGGPDRLVAVRSDAAQSAAIVGGTAPEGLPIPAGSTPSLSADGAHVELSGIDGALDEGRMLPLTLVFETAGEVSTRARISTPAPATMPPTAWTTSSTSAPSRLPPRWSWTCAPMARAG
ncbi:copper chaperone PCu(A)C [Seohaeicola zhoushanensis]